MKWAARHITDTLALRATFIDLAVSQMTYK